MTEYQELKKRFKKIGLTVIKQDNDGVWGEYFDVFFSGGIQKGNKFASVKSMESLKELLKRNE